MSGGWFGGRSIEARALVDIAQTPETFHAHAVPDGVEIGPGDVVLVHDVPTQVGFGEAIVCECRATVTKASALGRWWTEFASLFELTELYEVGFQPKGAP